MKRIQNIKIDFNPLFSDPEFMNIRVEVLVNFDDDISKKICFTHLFDINHFEPMWERLMERAIKEIKSAVRDDPAGGKCNA